MPPPPSWPPPRKPARLQLGLARHLRRGAPGSEPVHQFAGHSHVPLTMAVPRGTHTLSTCLSAALEWINANTAGQGPRRHKQSPCSPGISAARDHHRRCRRLHTAATSTGGTPPYGRPRRGHYGFRAASAAHIFEPAREPPLPASHGAVPGQRPHLSYGLGLVFALRLSS